MIQMLGIDYTTAPVDIRAIFALRKSELPEVMDYFRKKSGASGVVILSTCNRMEIWISGKKRSSDLLQLLCSYKNVRCEEYKACFTERFEEDAVQHLFWLTSGLKSAIIAEDQILTQVKDAGDTARMYQMTDGPLEVLFRSAVTSAKQIKTDVVFHRGNATAIEKAIDMVQNRYFSLSGKQVMVIGNGEYGRLAARQLLAAGANVTVTIRQYHSGEVKIPEGASTILYGDKYELFPQCDLIVSATSSPNYTLFYDKVSRFPTEGTRILIDLAVPRDIDPEIKNIPGYVLYDIDDFSSELGSENTLALQQAQRIIDEHVQEYQSWITFRDVIPMIQQIREDAVKDICGRLEKPLARLPVDNEQKASLQASIEDAAGKVISNLFYYYRDHLDESVFRSCVQAALDKSGTAEEN